MEAVELLWSPQSALGESQSDRDSVLACERHPEEEDFPAEPRCCLSWQMDNLSDTRRYKSCLDPSHTLVPIIPCAGGRHLQVPQVIPGPQALPAAAPGTFYMAQLGLFRASHSDFSPCSSPAAFRDNSFSSNQTHFPGKKQRP